MSLGQELQRHEIREEYKGIKSLPVDSVFRDLSLSLS